jgi:ABC-type Fe3+/spermidine/putrescine transport system ATPase subunit
VSLRIESVSKDLGGRRIVSDLSLDVASGELVCLLGPSGCGKTTTLRMIGGFLPPDAGRVVIDGSDVTGLSPERRPTAMVFQNYALWPHMTVAGNIGFGLKLRGHSRKEVRRRVEEILALVRLTHHIESYPSAISGGEQQRVALARALVLEPKLLLLDEPLSNLDARLRVQVREEIKEIQQRTGITTLFVTHDQDEAMSISDRIAVMSEGRIEQYDEPDAIYRTPRTRMVADFVGTMNILTGAVAADHVTLAGSVKVPCAEATGVSDEPVELGVRPEDVIVGSSPTGASASVEREIPRGHFKELLLGLGDLRLRAFVPSSFQSPGPVHVSFGRVLVYREGVLAGDAD